MSNTFIAAWGFLPPGTDGPDFEAAKAVVPTLDLDELEEYFSNATGHGIEQEDADEVRGHLLGRLDQLKESEIDGADITTPDGYTLMLRGGSSYGDDPNDGFTAMSDLQSAPTVFRALGFIVKDEPPVGQFDIADLMALMDRVLPVAGDVQDGRAGGTVVLWATLEDGRVIALSDKDDPFTPDADDVVTVDGFTIGVYPSTDAYLAGGDGAYLGAYQTVESLKMRLTDILAGRYTEHLCDAECGDPEHPRDGRITLVY